MSIRCYLEVFLIVLFTSSASTISQSDILLICVTAITSIHALLKYNLWYVKFSTKIIFFFSITVLVYFYKNKYIDIYPWLGVLCKLLLAANVVLLNKEKFIPRLLKVVKFGSIISLPFFIVQLIDFKLLFKLNNIFGIEPIREGLSPISSSVLFNLVEIHSQRNCGFMWEPGAFAAVLVICLSLSFLQNKNFNIEKIVFTICILTTISTMGYIALAIVYSYFLFKRFKVYSVIALIPLILIFFNLSFVYDKLIDQWFYAESEVSNAIFSKGFNSSIGLTRFASILLDLDLVLQNPLIGLGFDIHTKGSENFYGETGGENIVRASGIMFSFVKTGILGTGMFFILLFKSMKQFYKSKEKSAIFIIIIFCILFSNPIDYSVILFSFLFLNLARNEKKDNLQLQSI